jgi:hypothetical protein
VTGPSSTENQRRIGVIAITGAGRSGSTILDNVLGQVPGVLSVGELRHFWRRGLVERRLCGCGRVLPECEVWGPIIEAVQAGDDEAVARQRAELVDLTRTRALLRQLLPFLRKSYNHDIEPLVEEMDVLYRAIETSTCAEFVVDSSKLPSYVYALTRVPSVDLRLVVHLIRDARAVSYSWMRYKKQLDDGVDRGMSQHHPLSSATFWNLWNAGTGLLFGSSRRVPYLRLRYEDLMADPERWVTEILRRARVESTGLPFLREGEVLLGANHTVSGNPSRFDSGWVPLREDRRWISDMPRVWIVAVTALTLPLLVHYGYRLHVGHRQ